MVRFRRNKKEEDYKDDYDEDVSDDITDDEKDIMLLLDLLDAPNCDGCPGDAGCC